MDSGRDLLVRGIGAAKAKSWDEARFFFERFLGRDPPIEMRVEAWRYLAEMSANAAEKRDYIGSILAFDPNDGYARRTLAVLDGRLNPEDIIDPDITRPSPGTTDERSDATVRGENKRLACPQCGAGSLVASSDGRLVVCQHCRYERPIDFANAHGLPEAHDFAATIWTQKGHQSTQSALAFVCDGCGASFLVPPGIHSQTCPFCGSTYVDAKGGEREVIIPDAILPFGSDVGSVRSALGASLQSEKGSAPYDGPFAVYLPVWAFTFTGTVHWSGYVQERDGLESRRKPISDDFTVIEQKALVCGSPALPESFQGLVDGFNLASLVPFNPQQLAGCLAATNQITLDEASVSARQKALESLRVVVKQQQSEVFGMEMTFERIGIDSYQMLLLPFWSAQVGPLGARRLLFINGQTGTIGHHAHHGLWSWIAGIIGLPSSDS